MPKHVLIIKCLHDAELVCDCGWRLVFTGEMARDDAKSAHREHVRLNTFSENLIRCNRAKEMLRVFYSFDSERESAVIDALADLQHLCQEAGVDFQEQLRIASGHFLAERTPL